ncbi:MAG TPA: acyltransferase [Polyangiales bacterium]|nr:acyltransferase [Polyangiales bacterium]
MRSPNIKYLVGLDHLRAFAALLIVFYHGLHLLSLQPRAGARGDVAPFWWISNNPLAALIEEGHTSVALFMVLSGFVFSVGALGRNINYGAYLKNRFLRIYPLFMFLTVVALAAFPSAYSLLALLQTLLFQGNLPGSLNIPPYTSMFWAVGIEFQFYLLFPLLHRFIEREGARWAIGAIALCIAMRLIASIGGSNARDVTYWHLLGRLDQFLIGMLAARVFDRLRARPLPWGLLTTAAFGSTLALVMAFNRAGGWPTLALWKVLWPTAEALGWGFVIVSYTAFASRVPQLISRPLAALGSISYSIYLLHYTFVLFLPRFIPVSFGADPNWASQAYVLLIVLPILLPLAALSYYVIERPFLKLRVRYLDEPAQGARQEQPVVPTTASAAAVPAEPVSVVEQSA